MVHFLWSILHTVRRQLGMQFSPGITGGCSRFQRTSPRSSVFLLALLLLITFSLPVFAQSTGGRVLGRVLDPTGAVVPGAALTLTNDASGANLAAQSSNSGDYIFPAVPVGTYHLQAQIQGFQNFVANGLTVILNATVTYDVKLTVGAEAQAVEVTAEAPLVDTTTTQLGAVINERAVQTLPLNSRDTYQLLQLQPGVQGVGGSRSEAPLVDTTTTQLGAVINERAVQTLPLNSRDTYQLLQLQPGVQGVGGSDLFYGSDKPGAVSVNGGRG